LNPMCISGRAAPWTSSNLFQWGEHTSFLIGSDGRWWEQTWAMWSGGESVVPWGPGVRYQTFNNDNVEYFYGREQQRATLRYASRSMCWVYDSLPLEAWTTSTWINCGWRLGGGGVPTREQMTAMNRTGVGGPVAVRRRGEDDVRVVGEAGAST
jgi:hypothetical protein